ncbi:MAG: hypothetical protein CMA11_05150 [Euryarchaeota archaeon]|nr:hypothetical protein [Euryarchaeota archaeon]|tara:strand:+ start:333 stop:587 length:255 start_codon:yes stop_codon:yes gene_type:complete
MTTHMTQLLFTRNMAGDLRKGERIPRRELPEFEEAGGLSTAIARDGLIQTALEDTNEYGPHSMIVLLMIVATITGGALLAFRYI